MGLLNMLKFYVCNLMYFINIVSKPTKKFEEKLINTIYGNEILNVNLYQFTTTYGYIMLLMTNGMCEKQ